MPDILNLLIALAGAAGGAAVGGVLVLGSFPAAKRTKETGTKEKMQRQGKGIRVLTHVPAQASAQVPGRSAVRLGLRLARFGEPTLLVEAGGRVRVARPGEARGAGLQYVGALGSLILARQREWKSAWRCSGRSATSAP